MGWTCCQQRFVICSFRFFKRVCKFWWNQLWYVYVSVHKCVPVYCIVYMCVMCMCLRVYCVVCMLLCICRYCIVCMYWMHTCMFVLMYAYMRNRFWSWWAEYSVKYCSLVCNWRWKLGSSQNWKVFNIWAKPDCSSHRNIGWYAPPKWSRGIQSGLLGNGMCIDIHVCRDLFRYF